MKKNRTTIIMVLLFFVGLSVLLYPSLSSYYNKKVQQKEISGYEKLLYELDEDEYAEIFDKADLFNEKLGKLVNPLYTHKSIPGYNETLNINGNGMIGYITIDKIDVELPIFHGTSEEVLSYAVGHIEGTSLPVGGLGTHSALSAHRGLPSAELFTYADRLEKGDCFTITILDRELVYEIDQIKIVEPDAVEELEIDKEQDYVTLVTCTPYGVNSHRLLIRGKRIENNERKIFITTEAFKISSNIVTPIVAMPIILLLILIIILKPINKKVSVNKYVYPMNTEVDKNVKKG